MGIDRLTQVWLLNAFQHSETPAGYAVYFLSSFMSHSCCPNASWMRPMRGHPDRESGHHDLRASRRIAPGEEICISYLSPEEIVLPVEQRRQALLTSKLFWCACLRCQVEESGCDDELVMMIPW